MFSIINIITLNGVVFRDYGIVKQCKANTGYSNNLFIVQQETIHSAAGNL